MFVGCTVPPSSEEQWSSHFEQRTRSEEIAERVTCGNWSRGLAPFCRCYLYFPDGGLRAEYTKVLMGNALWDVYVHGPARIYYEGGNLLATLNFNFNLVDSTATLWYANKQKAQEGNYVDGIRWGRWRAWNQNGGLTFEAEYAGGGIQNLIVDEVRPSEIEDAMPPELLEQIQ